ncbi:MAG: hypothetical protein JJ992_12110, partial [Planctomycetes bacterium]|nr:hypothetical protein [Planctomycetota bacterium]
MAHQWREAHVFQLAAAQAGKESAHPFFVQRIQPSGLLESLELSKAVRAGQEAVVQMTPAESAAFKSSLATPAWFHQTVFVIGVLAAVLTAFYMVLSLLMTFYGDFRGWRIVKGWKDSGY